MNDAEAVERIRALAHMKGGIDGLKIDDVEALLRRHDHFWAEFSHHSGASGMDCDCVELAYKFSRGEID